MPIIKLDSNFITHQLQCPEDKRRIEYCDKDTPGLYVEVRATSQGQGTYYLRYKDISGKTCHQRIGRTTEISLDEARKEAKTLKAEITLGADPRKEAKARKSIPTAENFWPVYLAHAQARKKTWKKDEQLWRIHVCDHFGHQKLSGITKGDVLGFQTKLKAQGLSPSTCNHCIRLLRQMFNLAIDHGVVTDNPARIKLLFEEKIERYLDEDQLSTLLTVLRTHPNQPVCRIAFFLLSTGARLREALQATWSQIDFENKVWRIPSSNTKNRKPRVVPLNRVAIEEVLNKLDTRDVYDHLFINKDRGSPYVAVHKSWSYIRGAAGLPRLRLHDLRHQYASILANKGVPLFTIGRLIGHASGSSVTERYSHLAVHSLVDASDVAADAIDEAIHGS